MFGRMSRYGLICGLEGTEAFALTLGACLNVYRGAWELRDFCFDGFDDDICTR